MRTSIIVAMVIAGLVSPATAQQAAGTQKAAPSPQTGEQRHQDTDRGLNSSDQPNEQMQREADKGIKTRNSGESGYVGNQDKSGASAHPPGRPESDQTTGSTGQTGGAKAPDQSR
jgi:hypothetical protein